MPQQLLMHNEYGSAILLRIHLFYDLKVKNDSEVSVFYRFEASCLGNLPLKFEITSSGAGTLAPGAAEAVHTLTVTWPSSAKDVSLAGEIDIVTVTLTCTQVD